MNTCISCKHHKVITAIVESVLTDDEYFTPNSDYYTYCHTDEVVICDIGIIDSMTYSGTKYPTCPKYEVN